MSDCGYACEMVIIWGLERFIDGYLHQDMATGRNRRTGCNMLDTKHLACAIRLSGLQHRLTRRYGIELARRPYEAPNGNWDRPVPKRIN